MRYPVDYIGITQGFSNGHKGIDLGWHITHNCPVYAVENGVVISIQKQKTGGNVIHIKHDGIVSEYAHLQDGSIKVKVNDKVVKGQQIANMGATGIVSGEHLHIGLYKGNSINYSVNNWLNPLDYLEVYEGQVVGETTKKNYGSKIKYHSNEWTTGKYRLIVSKAIRTSHELIDNIVKVKECREDVKPNLTSTNPNDDAYYKVGTDVDITETYQDETTRVWGKLRNCWIVLCNKDGSKQANKIG